GHDINVAAMTVSPDSRYIATSAADGSIIIWSGTASPQTFIVEIQCPAGIQRVTSLSFSDNSDFLAATGGSYVLIWRVSDGSRIFSFEGRPEKLSCTWRRDNLNHATLSVGPGSTVWSLSVSPLRSFLLVCLGDQTVPVLVRASSFKAPSCWSDVDPTAYTFLHGHTAPVLATCISPCERYIATASEDKTVRLWSSKDGSLTWTFSDHIEKATHVAFSPDGKTLASADADGRVCLYPMTRFVKNVLQLRGSSADGF
ncbi:WD40 repeat-like protein, partial [Polyporus arcularius HHB13444]